MSNGPTRVIWRTLVKMMKYSPGSMIAAVSLATTNALFQAASIYLYQAMFDEASTMVQAQSELSGVVLLIVAVTAVEIVSAFVQLLFAFLCQDFLTQKMYGHFLNEAHEKVEELELIDFEDAGLFDDIDKAFGSVEDGIKSAIDSLTILMYYVPYFVILFAFFVGYSPSIALILIFTFLPILVSQKLTSKYIVENENKIVRDRRKLGNYAECIVGLNNVKETRMLGAFGHFMCKYEKTQSGYYKKYLKLEKKLLFVSLTTRTVRALGYVLTYILLYFGLTNGSVTVGVFGAIFITMEKLNGIASELLNAMGEAREKSSKAKFYYDLMDRTVEKRVLSKIDWSRRVELLSVGFEYPCGDKIALEEVNLSVDPGEKIAIVGENGAGKSTLSKILLGLYQPTTGSMQNHDGKKDKVSEYTAISMLFQDYQRYKLSMRDNVRISECRTSDEEDDQVIVSLLDRVGLSHALREMPEGLDTVVSREFGQREMSGGEWQRLAIARAIFRKHCLLVLDEPTSSIDPLEETSLYDLFMELANGKTAFFITHRLGLARVADRIVVLNGGRIVESGTHDQLLAQGGVYSRMWISQKTWYE